jgi:hypothetical protein
MCVNLYTKYIECGHIKRAGREPCLNVTKCGPGRERTERVEGLCQCCMESLKKVYRMNGLDFSTRGENMVPGESTFENEI